LPVGAATPGETLGTLWSDRAKKSKNLNTQADSE